MHEIAFSDILSDTQLNYHHPLKAFSVFQHEVKIHVDHISVIYWVHKLSLSKNIHERCTFICGSI